MSGSAEYRRLLRLLGDPCGYNIGCSWFGLVVHDIEGRWCRVAGAPELVVLFALVSTVFDPRSNLLGRLRPRLLLVVVANLVTHGILLGFVAYSLQTFDVSVFLPSTAMLAIITVVWLATFEVMARWRPTFRPQTVLTYGASILFMQSATSTIGALIWLYATRRDVSATSVLDLTGGLGVSELGLVYTLVQLSGTVALLLLTYRLAAPGRQWYSSITVAHGGIEMSPSKTETTRLLGAAAVLNGSTFRRRIIDQLEDENLAAAPELGLDVRLLAQICCALERKERFYAWAFVATLPAWMVMVAIEPVIGTLIAVLATATLFCLREHQRRYSLASHFTKERYDPEAVERQFACQLDARIVAAIPSPEQNLVVYQGFTPFVGAGLSLGGWSFVINLDKAKEDPFPLRPKPFQLDELYEAIDAAIDGLALEGLTASDVFFVGGTDVRNDPDILPRFLKRPTQTLARDLAQRYRNNSDARVRHYRWFRMHDWSNELIVSQFFRCARRGQVMFVEINRYLLTPIADQYRTVDALAQPRLRHLLSLAASSLVAGPFTVFVESVALVRRFNKSVAAVFDTRKRARAREIADNPLFDYGAPVPFRQALSSARFLHYFQKIDSDFYGKVFDRVLLDAICAFLEAHDIDTADLKERQNVILNSGIIVQGGDVRAESLAVGVGAQATKTDATSGRPRVAQEGRRA